MNKPVLFITGASSGIGLATVKHFVSKGWQVAATMRNIDKAPAELRQLQGVKLYQLDVTISESINAALNEALKDFGAIDAVVNNAGYGAIGPFEGASEAQIRQQIDTNLMGVIRVIQGAVPIFRQQNRGVIINISSIAGRVGMPLYSLYHATKFAVEGLTESLYYELRPFNIRVRLVEPGPVETEFNGRSRQDLPTPEDGSYNGFVQKVNRAYGLVFSYASTPETVARTIYRATIRKGPVIRYPSGLMAKTLMVLNKLTPGSIMRLFTRGVLGL